MRLDEHALSGPIGNALPSDLQSVWTDLYGPLVASRLEGDTLYSMIRIDAAEFAYSDYGNYLRALGQAWDAGFVPEPLPNMLGSELPETAPHLKGVDADLRDLGPEDVAQSRGRFEPAG